MRERKKDRTNELLCHFNGSMCFMELCWKKSITLVYLKCSYSLFNNSLTVSNAKCLLNVWTSHHFGPQSGTGLLFLFFFSILLINTIITFVLKQWSYSPASVFPTSTICSSLFWKWCLYISVLRILLASYLNECWLL